MSSLVPPARIGVNNPRRETRNAKTFLCVGVVDAFKLGQLEAHHVPCGGADQFLFSRGVGVACYCLCRPGGVLLVYFAVDDEKGSSRVIQSVVFFESSVELVRIAADNGFVNQRGGAGVRLRAE